MPGKQVTQATFDAIVREAMTDFGLSPTEAVDDAREQLAKAGVTDFSNLIDPTGTDSNRLRSDFATIPTQLETALESNAPDNVVAVLNKLADSDDKAIAIAGGNGAVEAVARVLASVTHDGVEMDWCLVIATCKAVTTLCARNEANRTRFAQQTDPDGVALLASLLRTLWRDTERDVQTVDSVAAAVAAVQRRCEGVKRRVSAGETPDALLGLLKWSAARVCGEEANVDLFGRLSRVVRQWLAMDDVSATVAETFVRARMLSGAKVVTESGLRPLKGGMTLVDVLDEVVAMGKEGCKRVKEGILRECISVGKFFAVSDEICRDISRVGLGSLAVELLGEMKKDGRIVHVCLGLLRSLAGRDACKSSVFEGITTIREGVEMHVDRNEAIAEVFCALVAGLCLRRPDIGRQMISNGSISVVVDAMEQHRDAAGVLKGGCLAIRNAASRDEEIRSMLVSDGRAESAIRFARRKFPGACDEAAYFALEELDVLAEDEMRRDDRYTMPAGFYQRPLIRKGERSIT